MKKVFVTLFLVLLMTMIIGSFAMAEQPVDWDALINSSTASETADTATVTTLSAQENSMTVAIDWGAVFRDIVNYAITGVVLFIAGVLVYMIIKYLIPMLPAIVQWLNDKRLLWLARILVNAAEVLYGRYNGDQKLDKVYQWLKKRGITVTDEVQQMINNAWQELNNKMIELGLKQPPVNNESGDDPFSDTKQPVAM